MLGNKNLSSLSSSLRHFLQPFSAECHYNYHTLEREKFQTESLRKTIGHLKEGFYVDNLVTSVNDATELEQLKSQSIEIMKEGAFELRCWASNDSKEDQDKQMVLGLSWDVVSDELSCKLPANIDCTQEKPVTKRVLLSVINSVNDPIGFTAPALLLPKLLMQEAWRGKIGWDEDGVESVAKLRLAISEIIRPLQRIYPLELSASDHLIEDHQGTDIAAQDPGPTAADVLREVKKSRCGRPLIPVKRLNL
ncbi:hypothetical protein HNY73_023161 [Argiope bruennichi]|uniref:Uncharacterized protein n=1 Tax=Argiope bruennichi TaxID=94029 RepID=A0A8T0E410_ARGBR|nr:hypothetical protein HNY73_023161 [Argiope bruennichi]